jgi:hypothetical protein
MGPDDARGSLPAFARKRSRGLTHIPSRNDWEWTHASSIDR